MQQTKDHLSTKRDHHEDLPQCLSCWNQNPRHQASLVKDLTLTTRGPQPTTTPRSAGLPPRHQDPTIPTKVRMQRTTGCTSTTSTQYCDQRSLKNCKTSDSDNQEDQPRWPSCWNQELTQRENKEVHIIPPANIEYPRHQASLSLFFPYAQPGKRQQIPPQEHPLQQTNKHRHSNLSNCVYNSLHRSFYSHQHKPEPTTVT